MHFVKEYLFRQYYGYQESGGGGGPPPGSGATGGGPGVVDYQPPPPQPGEYPLPYYGGYPPPPHPPPPPPNPAYLHSQGRPFVDRKYHHLLKENYVTLRKDRNSISFSSRLSCSSFSYFHLDFLKFIQLENHTDKFNTILIDVYFSDTNFQTSEFNKI